MKVQNQNSHIAKLSKQVVMCLPIFWVIIYSASRTDFKKFFLPLPGCSFCLCSLSLHSRFRVNPLLVANRRAEAKTHFSEPPSSRHFQEALPTPTAAPDLNSLKKVQIQWGNTKVMLMLGLTVHDHTYTSLSSFVHPLPAQGSAQVGTRLWARATLGASALALLNFLGEQTTWLSELGLLVLLLLNALVFRENKSSNGSSVRVINASRWSDQAGSSWLLFPKLLSYS